MTTDTRSAADPGLPKSTRRNVLAGLAASAVAISASGAAASVSPDCHLTALAADLVEGARDYALWSAKVEQLRSIPIADYEAPDASGVVKHWRVFDVYGRPDEWRSMTAAGDRCAKLAAEISAASAVGFAGVRAKAVALAWWLGVLPQIAENKGTVCGAHAMQEFIASLDCMVASEARS